MLICLVTEYCFVLHYGYDIIYDIYKFLNLVNLVLKAIWLKGFRQWIVYQ